MTDLSALKASVEDNTKAVAALIELYNSAKGGDQAAVDAAVAAILANNAAIAALFVPPGTIPAT